jgi:cytoskeletal protein CcmA (bactofilin family)
MLTTIKGIKSFLGFGLGDEIQSYTVISKNTKIIGEIQAENLFIEGEFLPNKNCVFAKIQIPKFGIMDAKKLNIISDSVEVAGEFYGHLNAETVILRSGSWFEGDITYTGSLIIEENSVLIGKVTYKDIK